nr:MAG TPA: hypothetical protein [Caudoviricetes sp.]
MCFEILPCRLSVVCGSYLHGLITSPLLRRLYVIFLLGMSFLDFLLKAVVQTSTL